MPAQSVLLDVSERAAHLQRGRVPVLRAVHTVQLRAHAARSPRSHPNARAAALADATAAVAGPDVSIQAGGGDPSP